MKTSYSAIRLIPKGKPLPEIVNAIARKSLENISVAKHVPYLTYKFVDGVCVTYEALVEFDNAQDALRTAEEKRWYGRLVVTNEKKVYFVVNVLNDNVYFDKKKRDQNETDNDHRE
jgi:hypothetical protein